MSKKYIKQKKFDKIRFEYLVKGRDNINTLFHLWSTFFSVAIGALFVGYYTMADSTAASKIENIVISFVGYFVSLFWHLSCKGYYWWVRSWINLVINCELKLPKQSKIYSCYSMKDNEDSYYNPLKPANISTGKLLGLFSFGITVVWGISILHSLLKKYTCLCQDLTSLSFYFICFVLSLIITIIFCHFAKYFKHDMNKHENISDTQK